MNIKPVTSPGAVQEFNQSRSTEQSRYQQAIKAAAGEPTTHNRVQVTTQPPAQVVHNQSNITPEEMGAIQAPKSTTTGQEELSADTAVETTLEETKPKQPTSEEEAANRRFIALARQEKALRAKEQAIKAREAELEAKSAALQVPAQIDTSKYISRDQFKNDPLSVLAEVGLSYDELTQQILNQPTKDPRVEAQFNELRNEIKRLNEANEQARKSSEEQQTQSYQAAVKQIEVDVTSLVDKDPTFATVRAEGRQKDVVELITETYKQDGVLLSVEEAAQQVEDYLVDHVVGAYEKLTKIEKIKKRLEQLNASNGQATSAKPVSEQPKQQQQQMKTLTNNVSSSRQLTARERAMLAFKNELK